MPETHQGRSIDRWLKYAAVFGPLAGVILGAFIEVILDHDKVMQLWNWKQRQEDFNFVTVKAIARMEALVKDPRP